MKTTASPHLLIVTASLLGMIAFAAEGYATDHDDERKITASPARSTAPAVPASSATKEPLPSEIAAKPATDQATTNAPKSASDAATNANPAATAPTGETVNLPAVVVESPAPTLTSEATLTNKGAGAAARDRQFSGDVDRALNSKTLPLVGKTPEERALAKEQEEKRLAQIEETKATAESLKETKPAEATELKKDAYDMSLRPNSFNEDLPPSVRRDAPR